MTLLLGMMLAAAAEWVTIEETNPVLEKLYRELPEELASYAISMQLHPGDHRTLRRRDVLAVLGRSERSHLPKRPRVFHIYRAREDDGLRWREQLGGRIAKMLASGHSVVDLHWGKARLPDPERTTARVSLLRKLGEGRHRVVFDLYVGERRIDSITCTAVVAADSDLWVSRGAIVHVVARSGTLAVRTKGIVQKKARVGEAAQVLTRGATRLVTGFLTAKDIVEVWP